jgi:hypothetical protein
MRAWIVVLVTTSSLWGTAITGQWVVDESASLKEASDDYAKLIIGLQVKERAIYEFAKNGTLSIYREGHKGEKGTEKASYDFKEGILTGHAPERKIKGLLSKEGKLRFTIMDERDKRQTFTLYLIPKGTATKSRISSVKRSERVVDVIQLKPDDFPWTKEEVKAYTLKYPKVSYVIQENQNTYRAEISSDGGEFYQYQGSDDSFSNGEKWRKFSPFFPMMDNVTATPVKKEKLKTSVGTFQTIKVRFDNLEGNYAWLIVEKPGIYAKYTNGVETYLLHAIEKAKSLKRSPIVLDRVYKSTQALRGKNVFCTFLRNGYFKYIFSSQSDVTLASINQHSERFKIEGGQIIFESDGAVLDIQSRTSFKLSIRGKELLFEAVQ